MLKKLNVPSIDVKYVINYVKERNKKHKNKHASVFDSDEITQELIKFEKNYEDVYAKAKLSKIILPPSWNPVEDEEKKKNTKTIFDEIYAFVRDELYKKLQDNRVITCPICGKVLVLHSLDHVFDKAKFPQYTIIPKNLVPTCNDCNFYKRSHESKKTVIFNSYYEEITIPDEILDFKVNAKTCNPIFSINFSKNDRLKDVMETYGLNERILASGYIFLKRLLKQLENVYMTNASDNKITNKMLEKLLKNQQLTSDDYSRLVIKALLNNEEDFFYYVKIKLDIVINSNASVKEKLKIEIDELRKELSSPNDHLIRMEKLIEKI